MKIQIEHAALTTTPEAPKMGSDGNLPRAEIAIRTGLPMVNAVEIYRIFEALRIACWRMRVG